jgi:VCBS repeat protein
VANWALGTIGVLIGNGDGAFQTIRTYDAGAAVPSSVVLADLNGDSRLDIAVASFVDIYNPGVPVGVLLGNGDATFQPVVTYASGGRERAALAAADVNGDAISDLLVTSGCLLNDYICAEGNVGLLLGNGDGTFQAAVIYGSGARFPQSITAVDVNADGKRDVVVTNYGSGGDRGVVAVLLNAPVDKEGPLVTVSARPTILWPPNGRMVPVTVSGTISDTGSGLKPDSLRYNVIDEYGKVQPAGDIALGPDGSYSVIVWLQPSREGSDRDGRHFTVYVSAVDNAGNSGSNQRVVIVPHDLRK